MTGAKVLAASIIDLLTTPELLQKARAEFEVECEEDAVLLAGSTRRQAVIAFNRAEMEKYRAEMRKFYLDKTPRFN